MKQVKLFPITPSLLPTQDLRSLRNLFMAAEEVLKMEFMYLFVYFYSFNHIMRTCRNTHFSTGIELKLSGLAESPFTPLPIPGALKKNLLILCDESTTYDLEWVDTQIGELRRSSGPRKAKHLAVIHTPFSNSSPKGFSDKGTPCTKCEELKTWYHSWLLMELERLPCDKRGESFVTRFYMGTGALRLRAELSAPQSATKPKSFLHISKHGFPSLTVLKFSLALKSVSYPNVS